MSVFDKLHKSTCRQDLHSDGKSDVLDKARHCGCTNAEKSIENELPSLLMKIVIETKKNRQECAICRVFFFVLLCFVFAVVGFFCCWFGLVFVFAFVFNHTSEFRKSSSVDWKYYLCKTCTAETNKLKLEVAGCFW